VRRHEDRHVLHYLGSIGVGDREVDAAELVYTRSLTGNDTAHDSGWRRTGWIGIERIRSSNAHGAVPRPDLAGRPSDPVAVPGAVNWGSLLSLQLSCR
jgi:hypothetical protein